MSNWLGYSFQRFGQEIGPGDTDAHPSPTGTNPNNDLKTFPAQPARCPGRYMAPLQIHLSSMAIKPVDVNSQGGSITKNGRRTSQRGAERKAPVTSLLAQLPSSRHLRHTGLMGHQKELHQSFAEDLHFGTRPLSPLWTASDCSTTAGVSAASEARTWSAGRTMFPHMVIRG